MDTTTKRSDDVQILKDALASPEQYRCNCRYDDGDYIRCDMCSRISRLITRVEELENTLSASRAACGYNANQLAILRAQAQEYEAALGDIKRHAASANTSKDIVAIHDIARAVPAEMEARKGWGVNETNWTEIEEAGEECIKIISGFFSDDQEKANTWWHTRSPMLGGIEPYRMLYFGRAKKLLKILKDQIEGNIA